MSSGASQYMLGMPERLLMTVTAYAEHRGVSRRAVQHASARGVVKRWRNKVDVHASDAGWDCVDAPTTRRRRALMARDELGLQPTTPTAMIVQLAADAGSGASEQALVYGVSRDVVLLAGRGRLSFLPPLMNAASNWLRLATWRAYVRVGEEILASSQQRIAESALDPATVVDVGRQATRTLRVPDVWWRDWLWISGRVLGDDG